MVWCTDKVLLVPVHSSSLVPIRGPFEGGERAWYTLFPRVHIHSGESGYSCNLSIV